MMLPECEPRRSHSRALRVAMRASSGHEHVHGEEGAPVSAAAKIVLWPGASAVGRAGRGWFLPKATRRVYKGGAERTRCHSLGAFDA